MRRTSTLISQYAAFSPSPGTPGEGGGGGSPGFTKPAGRAQKFLATMGGVGFLPASGTFASLLTCLILWPILANLLIVWQTAVALLGLIIFSALNIILAPWAIREFGDKDPGQFVLDEAAGICLTILLLPPRYGADVVINLAAAFLAFRIFDITKPPPARQLERLPMGWGILFDDLAAAVYANLVCQVVLRFLI